jgi:hypothetical protein
VSPDLYNYFQLETGNSSSILKEAFMNNFSAFFRIGFTVVLSFALFSALCLADDSKPAEVNKLDPCTILNKTEIQAIVGKPVGDGKLNPKANPVLGAPCEFTVGEGGVFSLWVGLNSSSTYENTQSGLNKSNIKTTDAPGIGDKSFFADQGYGMLQLNTWKGTTYLIITMMIPGADAAQQKTAAEKLMKLVLTKI